MKIYKYVLKTDCDNEIELPLLARVIHVHEQNNLPCIWVEFCDEEPKEARMFFCIVSGIDFDAVQNHIAQYRGTCHLDGGKYVVHVYEKS